MYSLSKLSYAGSCCRSVARSVHMMCYFWQYSVCFLFYFLLLSSLHSIIYFCNETEECAQSRFSAALQPVESVGSLCVQHPGKCVFSWSDLLKITYLYSCSSLSCCTALKVWNAWSLIVPGICISSPEETLPAAVTQGALESKDTEDGSVCFLCSLGFVTGSGSSIWPSTEDHLGTQR